MSIFARRLERKVALPVQTESSNEVESLVQRLASPDGFERNAARRSLAAMGRCALPGLEVALTDPRDRVREEAGKALGDMYDVSTAPALTEALRDTNGNVRWVAAKALAHLEQRGLPALLLALMHHSDSRNLRECACYILVPICQGELKEVLSPVVAALHGVVPASEVPPVAHAALHALRGEPDHRRNTASK